MNKKGKAMAESLDDKWLWVLALLCDMSLQLNDLSTKTSRSRETHFWHYWAVRAFEIKIKLLVKNWKILLSFFPRGFAS
jgi:hypothetical protein